jgi:hypothetical protein
VLLDGGLGEGEVPGNGAIGLPLSHFPQHIQLPPTEFAKGRLIGPA